MSCGSLVPLDVILGVVDQLPLKEAIRVETNLLEYLCIQMEAIAPEGTSFGPHPGGKEEGGYGFWEKQEGVIK